VLFGDENDDLTGTDLTQRAEKLTRDFAAELPAIRALLVREPGISPARRRSTGRP
jgi:hypothetical protein